MEVIETQPEIDYVKIGQRIRAARLEKGYSQADLGALVGCSNNHMSHVEVGQTKVSLAMLLKLAFVLEKNFDYFLLDTPYNQTRGHLSAINLWHFDHAIKMRHAVLAVVSNCCPPL